MRVVICSVMTALVVLSLGAEARIGGVQRKLQGNPDMELMPDLEVVDDGNIPPGSLGLCQGECDRDEDCAEGLYCFQREPNDPIPGCPDEGPGFDSRGDFCVMAEEEEAVMGSDAPTEMEMETETVVPDTMGPTEAEMVEVTVAPTEPEIGVAAFTSIPTEAEIGIAISTYIPTGMAEEVETVAPTDGETVAPTSGETMGVEAPIMALEPPAEDDEMAVPETMDDDTPGQLSLGGQDGVGDFPLSVCQGDCDNDGECGEGLICWQRDFGDEVPGCVGGLDATTDFCVLARYGDTVTVAPVEGTMGPTEGGSMDTMSPTTASPSM